MMASNSPAQRIPLQLVITRQRAAGDEELRHLLLPELAVARGEGRLDVDVRTGPAEVERRLIVPDPHGGGFAGTARARRPARMARARRPAPTPARKTRRRSPPRRSTSAPRGAAAPAAWPGPAMVPFLPGWPPPPPPAEGAGQGAQRDGAGISSWGRNGNDRDRARRPSRRRAPVSLPHRPRPGADPTRAIGANPALTRPDHSYHYSFQPTLGYFRPNLPPPA
jgi:hypothetical protein